MGESHLRGPLAGAVSKHNGATGFDRPQILLPQHLKTRCDQWTYRRDSAACGDRRAVNALGIRPGKSANIDSKNPVPLDRILVASDKFTGLICVFSSIRRSCNIASCLLGGVFRSFLARVVSVCKRVFCSGVSVRSCLMVSLIKLCLPSSFMVGNSTKFWILVFQLCFVLTLWRFGSPSPDY